MKMSSLVLNTVCLIAQCFEVSCMFFSSSLAVNLSFLFSASQDKEWKVWKTKLTEDGNYFFDVRFSLGWDHETLHWGIFDWKKLKTHEKQDLMLSIKLDIIFPSFADNSEYNIPSKLAQNLVF